MGECEDLFAVVSLVEAATGLSVVRLTWATLLVGTDGRPVCATTTTDDAIDDVMRLGGRWCRMVLLSQATEVEA